MQCNDVLRDLSEVGSANPLMDEQRQGHIDSCPSCRLQIEALQDALTLLKAAPQDAPAPGFADRVMQRIALERAEAVAQVPSRRVAIVGIAVAAAALVALALVWAGSGATMALGPGSTLLTGAAGLVAWFANLLVAVGALTRAVVTAARALPTEMIQMAQYAIQTCFVAAFIAVLWIGRRGRRTLPGGKGLL